MQRYLNLLTAPLADKKLVFLEVTEPFLVNVKLAFFAAAAVAIPVLVYQIVVFIKPALSGKIRKNLSASDNCVFYSVCRRCGIFL